MTFFQIGSVQSTGTYANDSHFNVNILPAANTGETPWGGNVGNPLGSLTDQTIAALSEFRVEYTRFPAGQEKELFAEHGIVANGQLIDCLNEFLSYAHVNGIKVNLVVPVESLEALGGVGAAELYEQLAVMSQLIGEQYPGTVAAYELGNEYWIQRTPGDESREVDYGEGAAKAALALQSGMTASGDNPAILLQACGNLGGSYGNSIATANEAIQDSFSLHADPHGLIDGIVRNFYWRDESEGGFQNDTGIFSEDRGLGENLDGGETANWQDWTGSDLLRVVGEFNINRNIAISGTEVDIGIHGASFILEHYTNLVEADIDFAFAWPIIHSTQNAYINRHEEIVVETINGIDVVVNSTRAAMFDILGEVTVGLELVNTAWHSSVGTESLELTLFREADLPGDSDQRSEIFLSSRSSVASMFSVELAPISAETAQRFAYVIGYDSHGGNHRNAVLREIDLDTAWFDGVLNVFLNPYEVLHITSVETFLSPDSEPSVSFNVIAGTSGNDFLMGLGGADSIEGGDGDDVLIGKEGDDLLNGGFGNDTMLGGAGDDNLIGAAGADVLDGGIGNDWASGGAGADTILGLDGADVIEGGDGNDFLVGGTGADTIRGDNDDDRIHGQQDDDLMFGGAGNDTIFGEDGFDILFGEAGDDLLIGGGNSDHLLGGDGDDELIGGWGFDTLDGGTGDDILNGGAGADVLTGGAGADDFYFDAFEDRLDTLTDFAISEDRLVFDLDGFNGNYRGIDFIPYDGGGSTIVRYFGFDGVINRALGGIVLDGVEFANGTGIDFVEI